MTSSRDSVSSSGITVDSSTGERYIPSSTRADGSKRREIRVRPGYRPPEDVELYRNRAAEAWKNRGKAGVPGAEGLSKQPDQTRTGTAASNKNAKRREARKKAKATDGSEATDGRDADSIEGWRAFGAGTEGRENLDNSGEPENETNAPAQSEVGQDAENEKKARNLKKKLRQAKELRDKKSQGESLLPEQLEKVIKIQELVRQLDALGFDSNGEKKGDAAEDKNV